MLGFATDLGSVNSHTAILARSLGIPAVVGLEGAVLAVKALTPAIIDGYARDAGVRRLEKQIGKIVRKSVVKILDKEKTPITITKDDIEGYLGPAIFKDERKLAGIGIITGLAWTAMGGATLSIEATVAHGYTRGFKLTGQLGDVMRESAEIAYSYVLSHAGAFGAEIDVFRESFIHLHVPAGATPKDGPSAGITMASALLSLALGRKPVRNIAMTGELTLTGQVFPDGSVSKPVTEEDQARLDEGAAIATEILVKAGVDPKSIVISSPQGGHPGGTAAIGRIVNENLQTSVDGLFVCDASVLPRAPGMPCSDFK